MGIKCDHHPCVKVDWIYSKGSQSFKEDITRSTPVST